MCARLTTAGYKGSLWCQPENGLLRKTGFYGVMLHFLNHTIKAWSREKRQRERERVSSVHSAGSEGGRGIASFTESDLRCGVEKREVLDR